MNRHEATVKLDRDLSRLIAGYHRLRWIAIGVLGGIIAMAVILLGYVVYHQQQQITAACAFFDDLAKLPLVATPPAKRPSRVGVTLVIDSYRSAAGLGCPQLPVLDPSVRHWADYYHIPLP